MKQPHASSFFYTYYIVFRSLWSTLYTSICCLARASTRTLSREWIDHRLQTWTKTILNYAKVDWHVYNPHHVEIPAHRATIIMCNHSSLYDIPLSFLAFPKISLRMLAKKELTKIPFFGQSIKAAEFPNIDRHHKQRAIQDLQKVKELLGTGIVMWIAPEGTRPSNGKLGPFKKGGFITAIETHAVIIPIGLRGADKILPPRSRHLQLYQRAEIHIGQPIDTQSYSLDRKDELIAVVRKSMLNLIDQAE